MRLGIASGTLPGRLRSSENGAGNKKRFFASVDVESGSSSKKFQPQIRRMEQTFLVCGNREMRGMTDGRKKLLNSFIVTE